MDFKRSITTAILPLAWIACTKTKVELPTKSPEPLAEKAVVAEPASSAEPIATAGTQLTEQSGASPAAELAIAPAQSAPASGETSSPRISGEVASQIKSQASFRVSGFIEEIKVKTGAACKKGEVLAVLDGRDYKLALEMARSQKELAKVGLVNAQSEFKREEQLKKENVSTESMYDKLKAGYEKAKLDLEMADLRLTQASQALQDTRLLAPYDCIVTKQVRNIGERVNPGDVVFELYNNTDIELSFSVPERLAGKIKVGDKLKVSIPATGFSSQLEIVRLVPVVEQASRTFKVIVNAPKDDVRILPGLYAEAQLQ